MIGYELPDEISLTLDEARTVLLALYDARDALREQSHRDAGLSDRFDEAIRIFRSKLVPDFPE